MLISPSIAPGINIFRWNLQMNRGEAKKDHSPGREFPQSTAGDRSLTDCWWILMGTCWVI
jgi:hypothetical protein